MATQPSNRRLNAQLPPLNTSATADSSTSNTVERQFAGHGASDAFTATLSAISLRNQQLSQMRQEGNRLVRQLQKFLSDMPRYENLVCRLEADFSANANATIRVPRTPRRNAATGSPYLRIIVTRPPARRKSTQTLTYALPNASVSRMAL